MKFVALFSIHSFNSWGWLDSFTKKNKKFLDVFIGDIRDPFCVKEAMKGCSSVIHLAALIGIPYSYYAPKTYIDTNVLGTLNLLQSARELSIKRFVHTSTSEVYGTAEYVPIDEKHPLKGQSPYSASKIAADQLVYSFFSSFNLPIVTVRPFNTYGPRQSARAIIPTVISQILANKKNIKLGSIHPTRDFSYISDTVNGFLKVLESNKGLGETVNLGNNFEISIEQTVNLIADIMNYKLNIKTDISRQRPKKSEVERLWSDNSKAYNLFGWRAKYRGKEGLNKGLIKTIDWFSEGKNFEMYKSDIYNL